MSNVILVMSLAGSFVLLIYILTYSMTKYIFKSKWKYNILRLSVIFYLIPFPKFKYIFWNNIIKRFYVPTSYKKMEVNKDFIILKGKTIDFSLLETLSIIFYILCILISICFISYKIIDFIKTKRIIIKNSYPTSQYELNLVTKLKNDINIKREVKLLKTKFPSLVLSTGVFCPIILISENLKLDNQQLTYILRHELAHIKYYDIIWKFLGCIAMSLHWFNPFSYLLLYNINKIAEIQSDEIAVLELDYKSKLKYCNTLIYIATKEVSYKSSNTFKFAKDAKNQIKERIDIIMHYKRKNKFIAVVLGITSFLIANAIIIFGYKVPIIKTVNTEYQIYTDNHDYIEETKWHSKNSIDSCAIELHYLHKTR